jgi:hypothetical protein
MILNSLSLRYVGVLALLLSFLQTGSGAASISPLDEDGKLIVFVKWGDAYRTHATNAYVEARGFVHKYYSQKSFVLRSSLDGRYETSLPPGVYDVFVSEGSSIPACKRVEIKAGSTMSWAVQLELDRVYSEK